MDNNYYTQITQTELPITVHHISICEFLTSRSHLLADTSLYKVAVLRRQTSFGMKHQVVW